MIHQQQPQWQPSLQVGMVVEKDFTILCSKINGILNREINAHPAYDNSFVLFSSNGKFIHVNQHSQIIKELGVGESTECKLHMLTDRDAIIFLRISNANKCELLHWNLPTGQTRRFEWGHLNTQLLVFPQTKMLCLLDRSHQYFEDSYLQRITYLQFPFKSLEEPVYSFLIDEQIKKKLNSRACSLNHHSGIYWMRTENQKNRGSLEDQEQFRTVEEDNEETIHIFDLRRQEKGVMNFTLKHNLNPNHELYDVHLVDVWEPIFGKMYVKLQCELSVPKFKKVHNVKNMRYNAEKVQVARILLDEEKTYELFWQYESNQHWAPKFAEKISKKNVVQFNTGFRAVSQIKFNEFDHRIFRYVGGRLPGTLPTWRKMDTHFINAESQELLFCENSKQEMLTSNLAVVFSYPSYSPFEMIQLRTRRDHHLDITHHIKLRKMNQFGEQLSVICAWMILSLVEDCDQDLIEEIIKIADNESWVARQQQEGWKAIHYYS